MKRMKFLLFAMPFLFASLPVGMLYLVFNSDELPEISNSTRKVILSSLRGEIYDVNLQPLVGRKQEKIVVASPTCDATSELKNYLNSDDYLRLSECINKSEPFVANCNYSGKSPSIKQAQIRSRYTDDGFCCHVIGYINSADGTGVCGIEKSFDTLLTSEKKQLIYTYNLSGYGKALIGGTSEIQSENYYSKSGIRLTIDYDIQRIAENAMHLYDIEKGACVVLDAENGEIRAMASLPKFNQNDVASYLSDSASPLMNRAVNAYSVGSVFKIVVAAAALKTGNDSFESYCSGHVKIGENKFSCSNSTSHGKMNLSRALAFSCNTYFIRLALEIGSESLLKTAEALGFGQSFSLADGFFSSAGKLPSAEEMQNSGMLANLSFGQGGLLATPLQIAACYSSCVNGGEFISPKLVISSINSDGSENDIGKNQYRYRAFSDEVSKRLKSLLENNFKEGTCVEAKPDFCTAGGKTSTAETGWLNEKNEEILHSWFAGFAEKDGKIYTIVVFKEDGESGGGDCGPVFREIADRICK